MLGIRGEFLKKFSIAALLFAFTFALIVNPMDSGIAAVRSQSATVSISGNPFPGEQLTSEVTGQVSGSKVSYQWFIGNSKISTASSIVLDSAIPIGALVKLKVLIRKSGYKDQSYVSKNIVIGQISNLENGQISGELVSANNASLTGTCGAYLPSLTQTTNPSSCSMQWKADGLDINGAQTSSLPLSDDLIGKRISLHITISAPDLSSQTFEIATNSVIKGEFATTTDPEFESTDHIGDMVSVITDPSYSKSIDSVSYQWLRDGKVIKNATGESYTLQTADWHKEISLRTSAHKNNYLDVVDEWTVVENPLKLVSKVVDKSNGFWAQNDCEYGDYWSSRCWTTGYKYAFGGNLNYNGYDDYTHMRLSNYSEFDPTRVHDWRVKVIGTVTRGLKVKVGVSSVPGMEYADYSSAISYSSSGTWVSRWSTIQPEIQYDQASWKYYSFVEARDANRKVQGTFKIVQVQIEVRYYN